MSDTSDTLLWQSIEIAKPVVEDTQERSETRYDEHYHVLNNIFNKFIINPHYNSRIIKNLIFCLTKHPCAAIIIF